MGQRSSNRDTRRGARALMAAALLPLALSCDLLLPPTGAPEEGPSPRATPSGAIEQLFRAYEDKRIDLFTELLPKNGTYRFFISPEYSTAYTGTDAVIKRIEDSEYKYVTAGNYHYWGQESELAKHRRMFNTPPDVKIKFEERPDINESNFHYTVNEENDTTRVELKTLYGELCIDMEKDNTRYCTQKDGQMQVFLLEREGDAKTGGKLWVIRDWFDLDYVK